MNTRACVAVLCGIVCTTVLCAGETVAGGKGTWAVISDGVIQQLEKDGKKPAWPGQSAGIAADRTTGDVYMIVAGQGIWRSSDLGATFERLDGGKVGGRCETSYSLDFDPNGKRAACFMLDGPGAMTLDGGKTWTDCKDKSRGFDNAAVDWSQENPKTIFAVRHEAGGLLLVSQDAGKTYKELGKAYKAVGVFSDQVFVATKDKEPGILRTTDGGATWTKVSDLVPAGLVARVLNGVGYWTSAQGLLVSKDKGATWAVQGSPVAAGAGPYFGKDEKQIVVVTKEGLTETTDAGQTWKAVAPLPPGYDFSKDGWFANFAWDPVHNVFYISRMGKPAMKFERP
ncbi:MAG: hypothetical protein NTW87_12570 [Planctomycetota bacterium]|nr:hypothetical protein [Planctomycetota bacterium]